MKRPLLVVAIGYIIGIVWGLYCNCSIALLYAIIGTSYLLIKLFQKSRNELKIFSIKRYIRYLKIYLKFNVILIIIITSIFSNFIIIKQNQKYNNLYANINKVELTGICISNPQEKEKINTYKIKVEELNHNKKFKNTYLIIQVKKDIKIDYGSRVKIIGEFIEPEKQRNNNGFDYKSYLKTQKVYGNVKASQVNKIEDKCINLLFLYSNTLFLKIKNNIQKVLPEKVSSLLLGIMLGYTDTMDEELKQKYRDSNMAHILAVSGMHISYISIGVIIFIKPIFRKKKKLFFSYIITYYIYVYYRFYTISSKGFINAYNNVM